MDRSTLPVVYSFSAEDRGQALAEEARSLLVPGKGNRDRIVYPHGGDGPGRGLT